MAALKRPVCNFCGNICEFSWYAKKTLSPEMLAARQREKEINQAFGEEKSLTNVLKELTNTYLVCQDCFTLGNYPRSLSADDFEAQTIKTILSDTASSDSDFKRLTPEDKEKLLQQLQMAEQRDDERVNWDAISKEAFKNKYNARDLVFEFITMPISESLNLDIEADLPADSVEQMLNTRKRTLDAANNFIDEYRQQDVTPTVFMDASNPLLA